MPDNENFLDTLVSSSFSRFMQMTGLVGKVGFRMLGARSLGLFLPEGARKKRILTAWEKNGEKIFETLGRLKGPAMKVGQMLSMQEGILPPEIINILRMLQKESPPLRFSAIKSVLEQEIPDHSQIFAHIEEKPYAAASIGQVHRGRLRDGTEVVIKLQYPGVDEMINGDLSNLKMLFKLLFSVFVKIDMEPVWAEIKERLLEETDYINEAHNQQLFAQLFETEEKIIVPRVIEQASAKRVLTSEFIPGMTLSEAGSQPEEQRNAWGDTLFRFLVKQVLTHGVVHADPHSGNFAAADGGGIIVYDYGNVKQMGPQIHKGYREMTSALYHNQLDRFSEILKDFGIHYSNGEKLKIDIVKDYYEVFKLVFNEDHYCFHKNSDFINKLMDLGKSYWYESLDITFPPGILFVQRALTGTVLNLNLLECCGNYREKIATQL